MFAGEGKEGKEGQDKVGAEINETCIVVNQIVSSIPPRRNFGFFSGELSFSLLLEHRFFQFV
jgi:hypothetical protein